MNTSSTPLWRIVAEREVTTKLRDKTFLGATAFTLVLLVAAFVVTSLVEGRATTYDVAVTTPLGSAAVADAQTSLRAASDDTTVKARDAGDPDEAEQMVRDEDVDAALVPSTSGFEIIGGDEVDSDLEDALTAGVQRSVLADNASAQGVDLEALQGGTTARVRLLDPGPEDAAARSAVAFAFAIIFLFTALGFGMTIAQSVVQEKESRIVEILAAAVPIRAMLWGKVIGNTVLALMQILLIAVVGMVGLAVTGRGALLNGIGPAVAWYIALFVLGFVSLASLWSVAGSVAGRQEDLQSTTLPGQMILFLPYFVSIFGSEQVKTVFSMLPIVSTMTMPGRIAEGHVPGWQIAVAIATTVVAAVLFVRLGERLYERTLLHTSGRLSYREALRAVVLSSLVSRLC
jgi:ABC-2 type transport system permease protein